MSLRAKRTVFLLVIVAGIGMAAFGLSQRTTDTKQERHVLQQTLAQGRSVPITNSVLAPDIDLKPIKSPDGGWDVHITTMNFNIVGENGFASLTTGYLALFLDGTQLASLNQRTYHIDRLSGRHILTVVMQNPQHSFYSHNRKLLSKTIDGAFSDEGFTEE